MTKEEIQKHIDAYNALREASEKQNHKRFAWFYMGKADAYIDIYNKLYPEMNGDRAFPLDEDKYNENVKEFEDIIKSKKGK